MIEGGRSGTSLLEFHGLLSLREEGDGAIQCGTGDNVGVGQAILAVEDGVADLVVELAT